MSEEEFLVVKLKKGVFPDIKLDHPQVTNNSIGHSEKFNPVQKSGRLHRQVDG